jgi:hypothetical protein
MAFELTSYIVDPGDGTIKVAHIFFGDTEAEAQRYRAEHLAHCKYMQGADSGEGKGELLEFTDEIDERPTPESLSDEEDDEEPEEIDEDEEPEEDDEEP